MGAFNIAVIIVGIFAAAVFVFGLSDAVIASRSHINNAQTMKIELIGGGTLEIDPEQITDYGQEALWFELTLMPGQIAPEYRAGNPYCYIKIGPYGDKLTITPQSLGAIHEAKRRKQL